MSSKHNKPVLTVMADNNAIIQDTTNNNKEEGIIMEDKNVVVANKVVPMEDKDVFVANVVKSIPVTLKTSQAVLYLMDNMIKSGDYLKNEIIKAVCDNFSSIKPITVSTYLTDSKNVRYSRFTNIAYEDNKTKKFNFSDVVISK